MFSENKCNILDQNKNLIFKSIKDRNIFILNMKINNNSDMYIIAEENDLWLWHKRFCHIHFKAINKFSKNKLVKGLPKMNFKVNNIYDACQLRKLTKSSLKTKKIISILQRLELLHLDLFGPMQTQSINHNIYVCL